MSQAEITAVNRIFEEAVRRRDLERVASVYTADAITLPPGGPIVQRRENIKRLWGSALEEMGVKTRMKGSAHCQGAISPPHRGCLRSRLSSW